MRFQSKYFIILLKKMNEMLEYWIFDILEIDCSR